MMTNAFKNSRSGCTLGCPRPRFVGGVGIGTRSTNWTNVTSNESWNNMRVPPILVAFNYHKNRSTALLGQPPAWLLIYDQASINLDESKSCALISIPCPKYRCNVLTLSYTPAY